MIMGQLERLGAPNTGERISQMGIFDCFYHDKKGYNEDEKDPILGEG